MKKLLLTVVVALCCVMNGRAQVCYGDSIPKPRYLTNMNLNLETGIFSFTDNFQTSMSINRFYYVSVYARHHDECRFAKLSYAQAYGYGLDPKGWDGFCIWSYHAVGSNETIWAEDSYGGVQSVNLTQLINKALEKGIREIIIFVNPKYVVRDEISGVTTYNSYYYPDEPTVLISGGAHAYNYHLINYYECDLPKVMTFELTPPMAVVHYGENIELNCSVRATGQSRLVFAESDEPGGDQRVVYDYTLSASEAASGKMVSYVKSFTDDGMPATKYYNVALYLSDGKAGERSCTRQFKYSLVVNSGTPQYYSPGELVSVPKTQCDNYTVRTVNDVPVNLTDNGSHMTFTMPACAIWLNSNPANYKVQFRDYDNTVLKKEDVSCGNYATAPSAPSHPGMSFAGWDKDINQPIYGPTVFRATYTYDGMEAVLSVQGGATYVVQGESVTFDMYAKSTDVQTAVYLQTAWLDDENDELEWSTPGSYTAIYTKAEAAAGTTKTKEVVVLPNGSLNGGHRARYFRLQMRLQGSNNYVYSNIVRIDTYYEVVVNTTLTNLLAYVSRQDGTTAYYENGKIYTRPQERIFAVDNDAVECGLKFQLSPTAYAVNSGDFWIDMPADLGEATTLTISREKHHVSFYMDGQQVYNPGEYGPQQVFCGNAATPPDIIAEVPGDKLFRGWKARGEYADDAYNCVTRDMEFDALLELLADGIEDIVIPKEKATKYLIDGQLYIATPQGRIYDVHGMLVK